MAEHAQGALKRSTDVQAGALALDQLQVTLKTLVRALPQQPRETLSQVQQALWTAASCGAFDPWTEAGADAPPKSNMLKGGGRFRKWKVQLFRIANATSHAPHCHDNLMSCLVSLRGRIHVREYNRDRATETRESTVLTPAFEGELKPGDSILTTEDYRNCHWFGAVGGPALAVNFKASGYVRFELLRLKVRRHVDLRSGTGAGVRTPFVGPQEGEARHSGNILASPA